MAKSALSHGVVDPDPAIDEGPPVTAVEEAHTYGG
jgi:hypothetical protein